MGILHLLTGWLLRGKDNPGRRGETLAAQFLIAHGYRVLARNLRNRFGEIDLIARVPDGCTVVIIEVKTAEAPDAFHAAELRVNRDKQRRLTHLACQVTRRYHLEDCPIRFDVIGVDLSKTGDDRIHHIPGAFESHV
ncbi:MAG: YraN family protein [Phycisphaera sp.]|nr:YraN family protein [Phycisphaera sp.]